MGVFGLSLYTTERDLREVFSRHGPLAGVNVVYDQRTGRSRGFAFVYFERLEDSKEVWDKFSALGIVDIFHLSASCKIFPDFMDKVKKWRCFFGNRNRY